MTCIHVVTLYTSDYAGPDLQLAAQLPAAVQPMKPGQVLGEVARLPLSHPSAPANSRHSAAFGFAGALLHRRDSE